LDRASVVQHRNQKLKLDPSNWKDFRFKGVISIRNYLHQELESFEVVPDISEFVNNGKESWLKQAVFNVDLDVTGPGMLPVSATLAAANIANTSGSNASGVNLSSVNNSSSGMDISSKNDINANDALVPKYYSFFYYLRHKDESRFDYLFNISISHKSIEGEVSDFISTRSKIDSGIPENFFEITDICNGHEIKSKIELTFSPQGEVTPILKEFVIQLAMAQGKQNYRPINDPLLTTKSLQNFNFRMEIARKGDEGVLFGPFSPSEQHLDMEDGHYYILQEIPLQDFSLLGTPKHQEKKLEKMGSYEHVFQFNYYARDRSVEDSSLFCIASIELSLGDVVKCSEGHQKVRDRFRLEKHLGLGMIRATFHFFVVEEMIPEPSTNGQALNPLCGYWLLERISLALQTS